MRIGIALCLVVLASIFAMAESAWAEQAGPQPALLNVPYGANEKQVMDVYPASAQASPLVVLVHGGGWTSGDKKTRSAQAKELQAQGFAVFNIDYRLDSKTVQAFPMEVEDTESATRYAIEHAAEHNANAGNVVLVGGSAGGQLVAAAAENLNTVSPGTVKGVVALSGAFSFPLLLQDAREHMLSLVLANDITRALGCALKTTCETPEREAWALQWSPAAHTSSCGSWLIFNSEHPVKSTPSSIGQQSRQQSLPSSGRFEAKLEPPDDGP
jgi:carboxylesterase type B